MQIVSVSSTVSPTFVDVLPGRNIAEALVLEAPRQLVQRWIDIPDISDGDALIRVDACGLCGTDHEQWSGALATGLTFIPGHETIGVVETIGPDAAAAMGCERLGDRIAVEVFQSCRSCSACGEGEYRRCERHGLRDMYGFIGVDRPPGLWGGYATHQYLGPDSARAPCAPGLDPVVATLFNPLGAGIRWGVTVPGTKPGDVVAVLGPGIRGLSALVRGLRSQSRVHHGHGVG